MDDTLYGIFIIGLIILVVIVIINLGSKSNNSNERRVSSNEVPSRTIRSSKLKNDDSLDSLIGLFTIGLLGLSAYKFIQSGGLARLLEEIGKLTINIDGEYKSISAAIKENSLVEGLVKDAVQRKLTTVYEKDHGLESITQNTTATATEVAQMLRSAVEARLKSLKT